VRPRWVAAVASTAAPCRARRRRFSIQLGNPRADSLASGGPARAGLEHLKESGIGTGPLSPFDALVRSGDPDTVAAALARVEGVRSAVRPRTGAATACARERHPDRGRQLPAGRATLDRLTTRRSRCRPTSRSAARPRMSADFLDAVYGNFPLMVALVALLTFILLPARSAR
jgi:RND superfamily putative drug exporter